MTKYFAKQKLLLLILGAVLLEAPVRKLAAELLAPRAILYSCLAFSTAEQKLYQAELFQRITEALGFLLTGLGDAPQSTLRLEDGRVTGSGEVRGLLGYNLTASLSGTCAPALELPLSAGSDCRGATVDLPSYQEVPCDNPPRGEYFDFLTKKWQCFLPGCDCRSDWTRLPSC